MKNLKDGPYTQADAEAAVGLKTDNGVRSKDRVIQAESALSLPMEMTV